MLLWYENYASIHTNNNMNVSKEEQCTFLRGERAYLASLSYFLRATSRLTVRWSQSRPTAIRYKTHKLAQEHKAIILLTNMVCQCVPYLTFATDRVMLCRRMGIVI